MTKSKTPSIVNRKAKHEFHFIETFVAGIVLKGTEIKSLREGNLQMADAFCFFRNGELFIKGLHISPYSFGNLNNQDPIRERKLLLSKKELHRLEEKAQDVGLTIIPVKVFFNDRNFAKVEIAVAKGKKLYDKREDIKQRDSQREIERFSRG